MAGAMISNKPIRLAVIVSHPIQYYVPIYRWLAKQDDIEVKVFFTWHEGASEEFDRGFKKPFKWDIPLTQDYNFELAPNVSREPGTHHFKGLQNPDLVSRVEAWRPDAVHLTGYAYASHMKALWTLSRRGIPVLFRGDSHLLDGKGGPKWLLKKALLSWIFRRPAGFLYVGKANREYYEEFGVPERKLFYCPHAVEVQRFASPHDVWEQEAAAWRMELGIEDGRIVLLFAGKFEDKKRPVQLMRAVKEYADPNVMLVMVGDGGLGEEVRRLADSAPSRFRVLPFQNQQRMPSVYRLGNLLALPSAYAETWGLAVNEAMACGRPAFVSDKVGCAADLIKVGATGSIFRADDWGDFGEKLAGLLSEREELRAMGARAQAAAHLFDIPATAEALTRAVRHILESCRTNSVYAHTLSGSVNEEL
jgi:glycosyltransferase involved in cell wall biosynthesis